MIFMSCPKCGRITTTVNSLVSLQLLGKVTLLESEEVIQLGVVAVPEVVQKMRPIIDADYQCPLCEQKSPSGEWSISVGCQNCGNIINHTECSCCSEEDSPETIMRNHYCKDICGCLCEEHARRALSRYCHGSCRYVDSCALLRHIGGEE